MLRCCCDPRAAAPSRAVLATPVKIGAATADVATRTIRFVLRPWCELTDNWLPKPPGGTPAAAFPHHSPQATEAPATTAAIAKTWLPVSWLPGNIGAACGAGAGAGAGVDSDVRELVAPASNSVVVPASVIISAPVWLVITTLLSMRAIS